MKFKQRLSFKVFMAFCFIMSCIICGVGHASMIDVSISGSLSSPGIAPPFADDNFSINFTMPLMPASTPQEDKQAFNTNLNVQYDCGSVNRNIEANIGWFDYDDGYSGVDIRMSNFYETGDFFQIVVVFENFISGYTGEADTPTMKIVTCSGIGGGAHYYYPDGSTQEDTSTRLYGVTYAAGGSTVKPSLTLSSASCVPGEAVTLNLELGNTTNTSVAAINTSVAAISTDIDFDSAIFEADPSDDTYPKNPSAVIGAAGAAAGKDVSYNLLDSNTLRVSVVSANRNPINNGIVASIIFYIKPTAINTITELTQTPSASDTNANSLTITGIKGTVTIKDCKLGDCNCDGTVSIAEVQSAIKMHMGKKTVESCCDSNNDNNVSITEVQAIINNHLGITVKSGHDTRDKKRPAQINVEHVSDGYSLSLDSNRNIISAVSIDIAYPVELAGKVSFTLGASAELAGKELVQNQIQPGITRIALISTFDNEAIDDGEILFVHVDGDSAEGDVSFKVTASDEAGGEIQVK